jgi:hypothetical protein
MVAGAVVEEHRQVRDKVDAQPEAEAAQLARERVGDVGGGDRVHGQRRASADAGAGS